MQFKLAVESGPDGLTLTVTQNGDFPPQYCLFVPNADLASAVNHVLGLARKAQEPAKPGRAGKGTDEHFEAFWALYPAKRRVNKKGMRVKWISRRLDRVWPEIQRSLYVQIPEWASEDFKFLPLVSTYINQSRWEVETEPERPLI